jgi:hypothetical protein
MWLPKKSEKRRGMTFGNPLLPPARPGFGFLGLAINGLARMSYAGWLFPILTALARGSLWQTWWKL